MNDYLELQNNAVKVMIKEAKERRIFGVAGFVITREKKPFPMSPTIDMTGRFYRDPDPKRGSDDIGTNYLAVALMKFAKMVRTKKPSGPEFPSLFGEHEWRGGETMFVGVPYNKGKEVIWLIAFFSGGTQAEDSVIAKKGLNYTVEQLL